MTDFDMSELSEAEIELLGDYVTQTRAIYSQTVAKVLTTPKIGTNQPFDTGIGDILHYISDSISATDRQVFRLDDMRRSLERMAAASPPEMDMPEDALITPEKLHWFSIRSELTSYYSQVGALIEEYSADLVLEKVIDEDRQSNRVKSNIENRSQGDREWLLFVTGVINSDEKGKIRSAYKRRNGLVHNSVTEYDIDGIEELESDISQGWDAVNVLHEKLFGLEMEFRISEKVLGNEF